MEDTRRTKGRGAVVTVDSLGLSVVHFIKIDIEGMECEALNGSEQTIEKYKPILYVENDRQEKSEALVRKIDSLGYCMYWHMPPMYSPGELLRQQRECIWIDRIQEHALFS